MASASLSRGEICVKMYQEKKEVRLNDIAMTPLTTLRTANCFRCLDHGFPRLRAVLWAQSEEGSLVVLIQRSIFNYFRRVISHW